MKNLGQAKVLVALKKFEFVYESFVPGQGQFTNLLQNFLFGFATVTVGSDLNPDPVAGSKAWEV